MPLVALALVIVAALALLGIHIGTVAATAANLSGGSDSVQLPTMSGQTIIPTNPSTWPSGDKLWNVARAIAHAEGYDVLVNGQPSNPARLNNPGDISDGVMTYGSEFHSGSNITKFPDAATGWAWLYGKLNNIKQGNSTVYDPSYSWREIGAKWAPPNAEVWAANVANYLGVDPDSAFGDYVNA
jgi:hypothetical protein